MSSDDVLDGPSTSSSSAPSSKLTAPKKGKRTSAPWDHFDELGRDKASCKICGMNLVRSHRSTTDMHNHLG